MCTIISLFIFIPRLLLVQGSNKEMQMLYHDIHIYHFILVIQLSIIKTYNLRFYRLQATTTFDTPLDSSIIDTIRHNLKTNIFAQDILIVHLAFSSNIHIQIIGNSIGILDYFCKRIFFMFLMGHSALSHTTLP